MTEAPEPKNPPPPHAKPNRLYQAAAWVVIVAGVVFVASVIFFAGAYVSNDGWRGHHHHGPCMMQMGPPAVGPALRFGFGPAGPGNGPGGPGR